MCRLYGFVSDRPRSTQQMLGRHALDDFTRLSAVHGDGWGMAWSDHGTDQTEIVTSARSAARDKDYADLTRTALGRAAMVHLRWATDGLEISPANTHPFGWDGYAFAHNGHVSPIAELEHLLTDTYSARLRGTTDSERYFQFVLQRIAETNDEASGVRGAVFELAAHFATCSLNALLLTPTRLFAVHVNSQAAAPLEDLQALFESEDEYPLDHQRNYFHMSYRVTQDAVHVISSGLNEPDWTPLPADSILEVDLASRTTQIYAVEPPRHLDRVR